MFQPPKQRQHRNGDHPKSDARIQLPGVCHRQLVDGEAPALPGPDPPHGQPVLGRVARVLLLTWSKSNKSLAAFSHPNYPSL